MRKVKNERKTTYGYISHIIKRCFYNVGKRAFDILLSLFSLIVFSPIMIVISILIKQKDGGLILYKRKCVGRNNKPFIMYKFRTMVSDADEYEKYFTGESLKEFLRGEKAVDDPRITKIGKWLRKSSLDELPQLISVLLGDMSIVGPRPVIEREAAYYGEDRAKLLSCKPGITGWWQVNGRGNLVYLSEETKRLQLYYVENQSLWLDIKILIKTV